MLFRFIIFLALNVSNIFQETHLKFHIKQIQTVYQINYTEAVCGIDLFHKLRRRLV